jgi:hypothetical protein
MGHAAADGRLSTVAIFRQPSIRRNLICPLATRLKSKTIAASSLGSEPCVFIRRRNSSWSHSITFVLRSAFHSPPDHRVGFVLFEIDACSFRASGGECVSSSPSRTRTFVHAVSLTGPIRHSRGRPHPARPEDPSLDTALTFGRAPGPPPKPPATFRTRAPAPRHDDSGRRASIPLLTSPLSPAPNAPLRVGVDSRGAMGPDGTSTAPAETSLIVPMHFFAFVGRYRLRVRRPQADTGWTSPYPVPEVVERLRA